MREFYRRHRGLHRWLLAVVALLAVYFALRPVPGLMNWLSRHVIMPWERAVASVCYLFRTSIAEVLYIVLLSVAIFYVANVLRRLVTQPHRGRTLYRFFLTVVCSGLSIYAGFCLLWGVNYYADSFQQQSGIYARSCTVEELEAVTADFAHQLAQAADNVQRDENGCFAVSRQEIFAAATSVYAPSYEEFPCLRMKDHTPKAISCSTVLSAMDFTGFYFPFTGEANLNVDCPASFLPSTIVHEMAHQRGIASEQECNFIAIAVSLASGDPVYRYSGLLMGYVHLGNALYRADPDRWQVIRDTLPDPVVAEQRLLGGLRGAGERRCQQGLRLLPQKQRREPWRPELRHRGGYAHGVLRVSQVAVRGAANSPKAQEQAPSDGRGLFRYRHSRNFSPRRRKIHCV